MTKSGKAVRATSRTRRMNGKYNDLLHDLLTKPSIIELAQPDNPVNPHHYADLRPEPIDAIEGWFLNFHLGTVVKYVARADKKTPDGLVDLEKARWYLDREIANRKKRQA
jgi:hypothetical protein